MRNSTSTGQITRQVDDSHSFIFVFIAILRGWGQYKGQEVVWRLFKYEIRDQGFKLPFWAKLHPNGSILKIHKKSR